MPQIKLVYVYPENKVLLEWELASTVSLIVFLNPPPLVEDPKGFYLYQGFKIVFGSSQSKTIIKPATKYV